MQFMNMVAFVATVARRWTELRFNRTPTTSIHALVSVATVAGVALLGCDQSSQVAQHGSTKDSTSGSRIELIESSLLPERNDEPQSAEPRVDESDVNTEGQIVLGQSAAELDLDESIGLNQTSTAIDVGIPQPAEANVTTVAERNQAIAEDWPQPQAVIFVSGQQHGYLEPCGCTGLDNQKGGLIRRDTLLQELRERGWEVVPVDVGNQVRRVGRQPEIKFESTVKAFELMGYRAAALGIDDLNLSSIELIQAAGSDELNPRAFISANVIVWDTSSFFPGYRIVEAGGRKIGITAALGAEHETKIQNDSIKVFDAAEKLKPIVRKLKEEGCDFLVLLAHSSLEGSASMARQVPGFDLVVTAGGVGEPTLHPEKIDGSTAVMIQVGTKGMYGGIIGLFDDKDVPVRYQKIAISSQFKDSERMLEHFALYQRKLQEAGYAGLGVKPIAHPTGRKFVGSEVCGDCHTTAFEIWEESPHVHATQSVVAPPNDRGGIPRHFDPECISCHSTGWNAQNFFPFETGFVDPETTKHLGGNGCENCHGPGKDHVDAENGDVDVDNETLLMLQQQMVIKLDHARDKCLECHDQDNSPDFNIDGAFEKYWEKIKHYGKD